MEPRLGGWAWGVESARTMLSSTSCGGAGAGAGAETGAAVRTLVGLVPYCWPTIEPAGPEHEEAKAVRGATRRTAQDYTFEHPETPEERHQKPKTSTSTTQMALITQNASKRDEGGQLLV